MCKDTRKIGPTAFAYWRVRAAIANGANQLTRKPISSRSNGDTMPDIFATFDKDDRYDERLAQLVRTGRRKITDTDLTAIRVLREHRNLLIDALKAVKRLREDQGLRDKAIRLGISGRAGLDEYSAVAANTEKSVDAMLAEILK